MLILSDPDRKIALAGLNGEGGATFADPASTEVIPLTVAVCLRIANPQTARLWDPVDLTGWTIKAGIGTGFALPVAGSFTLTFGANTTAELPAGASLQQVEDALNALASIIAAGGVDVTGSVGFYAITFRTNGARSQITVDVSELAPPCVGEEGTLIEGSADNEEVQTISTFQNPGAYANLTTVNDPCEIVIEEAGTKKRFTMSPVPIRGQWSISIEGQTTDIVSHDVSAADLQAALENVGQTSGTLTVGKRYKIVSRKESGPIVAGTLTNSVLYRLEDYKETGDLQTSGSLVSGKLYKIISIGEQATAQTSGTITSGKRYKIRTYNPIGTLQKSGTLTTGKKYQIVEYVSGDDFSNVGCTSQVDGNVFTATGTTPATWTNQSVLTRVDDFMNLGAAENAAGVVFTATGTTPASWLNGSGLVMLDDFSNVGAGNVAGEKFTASGTTPSNWTLASELSRVDDFSNIGGTNTEGEVFRTTGTTPASWTNGSVLILLDDFTNVGAPSNDEGTSWITTGTTPANWTNGTKVSATGPGNVLVTREPQGGVYYVQMRGDFTFEVMEFTADDSQLVAMSTLSGELDMRTAGIAFMLGTSLQADAIFEIIGTPPGGSPRELYRAEIKVLKGIISPGAFVTPPFTGTGWTPTVPTAADSAGNAGQWSSNGVYVYFCYAANSWGYIPLNTNFAPP